MKKRTAADVTLGQFRKYQLLENPTGIELLEIFYPGYKNEEIDKVKEMINDASYWTFLDAKSDVPQFSIVNLKGKLYGFNKRKLTFAEFTELNQMVQEDLWKNIHRILVVYYRPIKKMNLFNQMKYKLALWLYKRARKTKQPQKVYLAAHNLMASLNYTLEVYDYEKLLEYEETLLNLPLDYVYKAISFFYSTMVIWSADSLDSLKQEIDPIVKQSIKLTSEKPGDGTTSLTSSQTETSPSTKKSGKRKQKQS